MSLLTTLNTEAIITAVGYAGLFAIIFAESGLLFGFFLPGDSLAFTAGLLAATGALNLAILLCLLPVAAVLGDSAGYWFGAFIGPRIFIKEDSFFFSKKHVARSEAFYEKYGARALVLARFVPVVRTFVPVLAGVGSMRYRTFIIYNIIGAVLWAGGITLLGYFLGRTFPAIEHYLTLAIAVVIILSLVPIAREWLQYRRDRQV